LRGWKQSGRSIISSVADSPFLKGIYVSGKNCIKSFNDKQGLFIKTYSSAFSLVEKYKADRAVAEVNQGGDMIETILRSIDENIPYRAVHATQGKRTRAEPIAALYEQKRVKHVGTLAGLETQMTSWDARSEKSPDRVDALVWALTDLTGVTKRIFSV